MKIVLVLSLLLTAVGSAFAEDYTGAESVALAIAKANYAGADKVKLDLNYKTSSVATYSNGSGDPGEIIEVRVKTFENSSEKSLRIYRLRQEPNGTIVRATLFRTEGPVGP